MVEPIRTESIIPEINTDRYDKYYCAIVTAYKPGSFEIDEDAFRNHVRRFTRSNDFIKTNGSLIANPEAGEIFYLTPEERRNLIRIVMQERPQSMPIFAGCFGVRRDEVLESALDSKKMGADGIFVMPPSGTMEVSMSLDGSKNPEIWTEHVKAIAEATQLPIIVHAQHPLTPQWGWGIPLESVKMVLEQVPSVVGWKMIAAHASAHFRVAHYMRTLKRHVGIFNAPLHCYHTALMCGLVDGAVQGAYNFNMENLVEHTIAWREGNIPKAAEIWKNKIMPLHEFIYSDNSRLHIRYKLATWVRGFIAHPFMRPPMPAPRREDAERVFELMEQSGISHITRSEFERTLEHREEIYSRAAAAAIPARVH